MTPRGDAPSPSSGPLLADHDQRQIIRTQLDKTLVVEAAAGTGKTTELVKRMVAIIAGDRGRLERMVALTFTDAAAGELKLRLRAALEEERLREARSSEERDRLTTALLSLEEARLGTIHSFCADLLRERPVEAGVDPDFEVAAGDIARPLFERVFARWFERELADPGPGVRRILRRWKREPAFGSRRADDGPRARLRQAAWTLIEHRDFPAPWRHAVGFDRDATIESLLGELAALAEWAPGADPNDWFGKSLLEIGKANDELRRIERVRARDYDALEAWLEELVRPRYRHWGWRGRAGAARADFPRAELLRRRDDLHARLKAFADDAGAELAPHLRDELWPLVEAYEAAKERAGCLDFNDLLIRARDLVRENARVREELQRRFSHYFVDEFQDTDPLQVEILLLLASDDPAIDDWRRVRAAPGKLFLVGDPKQSIYRFRRADVALYREVERRLVAEGAQLVELRVSFRAVPEIQEAVNAAFAPVLAAPGYVPLAPHRPRYVGQPAVIALPVPGPYGDYGKIVDFRIDASLPDVIAAWVSWLVTKSGWTVVERERPDERVPVAPRHVCLLFRRFKTFDRDVTRDYVAGLEARQIPHLLVGGSSFHEREEIEALRNALHAIERPDDDLAVFATLRGPLLGLSDAALLLWRERFRSLHPFRPVPDDLEPALAEVAGALALLAELHRGRNRRPAADTIGRLLEATRAHAAFAIWPTGRQALANVSRLADLARRAEQQGLISFRGFVDRLDEEAERGEVSEALLLEEAVEGVRIMTVHRAKGLEFPVVILADMTANSAPERASRWTDPARGLWVERLAGCAPPELREHEAEELRREEEEALRLLYVAATRARDALVVPVIGDERREGWLSALHPALYPDLRNARRPESREVEGCPAFEADSVPGRPVAVMRPSSSVMPGLHQPASGPHRVAWWDPSVLNLGVKPSIGLSQTRILEADKEGRSAAALAGWEAWRVARGEVRERGARPTMTVRGAAEWVRDHEDVPGAGEVEIIDTGWPGERPHGTRFGTLVHALLASVDLDAAGDVIRIHAGAEARLLGATASEADAAASAVSATLAHPLMQRAAAAFRQGRARRESAIIIPVGDGALADGTADLVFRDDEAWTVVDFKTDLDLTHRAPEYRRQIALYVRAIREATGLAARGVILRV